MMFVPKLMRFLCGGVNFELKTSEAKLSESHSSKTKIYQEGQHVEHFNSTAFLHIPCYFSQRSN